MSTAVAMPSLAQEHSALRARARRRMGNTLLCAVLTPLALLVHGYHPYAEDGGIYLAGIKHLLHPQLFPYATGFVTAHLQLSVFAHLVAFLAGETHIGLMPLLFALYSALIFSVLRAGAQIAQQITSYVPAQQCAIVLLAASLTVPVAGTSLMMMDPYVTARSAAMPCVLAAIAAALRAVSNRQWSTAWKSLAWLAAATVLHPLCGTYGFALVAILGVCAVPTVRARTIAAASLVLSALAACMLLQLVLSKVPSGYSAVAQTRTYWVLTNWTWYEQAGLLCPVLIFAGMVFARNGSTSARLLATALVSSGVLFVIISLLFVHTVDTSYAVARAQPLRVFQILYYALPLFLGAAFARRFPSIIARTMLCAAVAACLFVSQRDIYNNTRHIEWPWAASSNAWQQAFLWLRDHTPEEAVIAVDAQYIHAPGEDAQNIRAVSERSTPADASKDGGIAAIRPQLTQQWSDGVALQRDLAAVTDVERIRRLRPRNIEWLVLPASSSTAFACPYKNDRVQVCHLPLQP